MEEPYPFDYFVEEVKFKHINPHGALHTDRIQKLHEFLKEDPSDVFTLYALALEYASEGDLKALPYFDQLLTDHSEYLPTYYHAGLFYADQGQSEKAINIFKKGIELAIVQQNEKARLELTNVLQNILYEED